jgi:tyrosinase
LDDYAAEKANLEAAAVPSKVVRVSGINRAPIRGSFLISAYAQIDGKKQHIGTEAVLSRWNVQYCANCQTHLEAQAFFNIPDHLAIDRDAQGAPRVEVEVRRRAKPMANETGLEALSSRAAVPYKVEIW